MLRPIPALAALISLGCLLSGRSSGLAGDIAVIVVSFPANPRQRSKCGITAERRLRFKPARTAGPSGDEDILTPTRMSSLAADLHRSGRCIATLRLLLRAGPIPGRSAVPPAAGRSASANTGNSNRYGAARIAAGDCRRAAPTPPRCSGGERGLAARPS